MPCCAGEETLELRRDLRTKNAATRLSGGRSKAPQQQLDAEDHRLWNALKALRKRLADEQDVPPYVIFHDATLMEMVVYRPLNAQQLRRLNGIGETKLNKYGDPFLELISEYPECT